MKQKNTLSSYIIAVVIAAVIALLVIWYEISTYGNTSGLLMSYCSDGFFIAAVFYIGFGILMFISETGNFYGIQYLGHMVVCLFSFRKERFNKRKDYFTYCTEKKAQQKDRGKSTGKWVLLFTGLGCLVLSLVFAVLFKM